MSAVVPFDAFKVINLGQTFGLSAYQNLYADYSEPVGLISVVQALGLISPSDQAVDRFNEKWTRGSARWNLHETGIEVVSGRSSTTGEMAKTRDGESALLVLSFFIESMGSKATADLVRQIVDKTPDRLVPIRPRRAQILNVVSAVESQTSCVSWQAEIDEAQQAVHEHPNIWNSELMVPSESFDLPIAAMKAFYQALSTVSRFPDNYFCTVNTTLSLTSLFVLVSAVCGLRVCVIVDGELVFGNSATGAWQVKLERRRADSTSGVGTYRTEVKLGRKLEDAEDLLIVDEVGPLRANRTSIYGIGRTSTIGQGLSVTEGEELAIIAIRVANSILQKWTRETVDESGDDDDSDVSFPESSAKMSGDDTHDSQASVPVKVRLTAETVSQWWGCPSKTAMDWILKASDMDNKSTLLFTHVDGDRNSVNWPQLWFSKVITGKIAEFDNLDRDEQIQRRQRTNYALDRRDYARVAHMVTSQLLLITFLRFTTTSKDDIRVRSSCSPQNSTIGRSIRNISSLQTVKQSDVLYSWYYWLHGTPLHEPRGNYGIDAVTTEGYLIYRSLLVDLSLDPDSCELVTIQPGHILSENQRLFEIRGYDNGYSILDVPHYQKKLRGPKKLRSSNQTSVLDISWRVEEGEDTLDLELSLQSEKTGFSVSASVYQIMKQSWQLHYGDSSIGCAHDEERVGVLAEGEVIDVSSAGALPEQENSSSTWKPLLLFSANENPLGQVSCLLSAPSGWRGMVRRNACLRCCITACLKMGLDFLID